MEEETNSEYDSESEEETGIINEFGEEISIEKITELTEKVRKLNEKDIDQIFFDCGCKEKARGKNKSLSDITIKKIKEDEDVALKLLIVLFQETKKDDFLYVIDEKFILLAKDEDFDEED
jgi:hypothetical protein